MGVPYTDQAVKILAVNKLLDSRTAIIAKQVAYTGIGMLAGAYFFGRKGAIIGSLVGAVYGYEPLHNYRGVLAHVKRLCDDEKHVVAGLLQEAVGSTDLRDLALYSEDENNANDLFVIIEQYLNSNLDRPITPTRNSRR